MKPAVAVPHVCQRYRRRRRYHSPFLSLVALLVALLLPALTAPQLLGASRAVVLGAGEGVGQAVFKVGSFVQRSGTGTQTVAHGLGETPKALIFWMSGSAAASGTWSADIFQSLGFVAGTSNAYAVGGYSLDAQFSSLTRRRMAAKAITLVDHNSNTSEADLSSWDATNFVLNWTSNLVGAAININFLAIGGADVQAKVVNWQTPTATGNWPVTGAGFQPDLVLHAGAFFSNALPASLAHQYFGFGAMNSAGEQWANSIVSEDADVAADTARYQRTDATVVFVENNATELARASYVSMNADGFTTNFAVTQSTARQMMSLCLKGVTSKVGSFNKTTAAAPATQSVNAGMQPSAVLLSGFASNASTTPITGAWHTVGATDGTNQRAASQYDFDGADPTSCDSAFFNDGSYAVGNGAGTLTKGSLALTGTGFDATFSPNDTSNANQILYLALA